MGRSGYAGINVTGGFGKARVAFTSSCHAPWMIRGRVFEAGQEGMAGRGLVLETQVGVAHGTP
jgi:hypothetical protein